MKNSNCYAFVLLAFSPLMWAGNFIAGRVMHTAVPPFSLSFYRWVLVVLVLLPFVAKSLKQFWPDIKKHGMALSFLSLFSMAINSPSFYLGLHFTSVINASLVYSTVPAFILLLSCLVLKEPLTGLKIIAILVSILGIVLIMTKGHPYLLLHLKLDKGDLAILIAAVSWAVFSVYLKNFPLKLPPLLFIFVMAFIGSVLLFPCFLAELYLGYHTVWSMQTGIGLVYAAVFSSVLGFASWNMGIARKGPAIAGYFFNLLPVYSTILAVLLLGEKMHVYHVFGIVFVLLGILLANFSK